MSDLRISNLFRAADEAARYQNGDIGDGDMFKDIEVGDLIRIGHPSTHGFTDYLTVVEKVK